MADEKRPEEEARVDAARDEALEARAAARKAALDARQLETERGILKTALDVEEQRATEFALGFYAVVGLVVAAIVVLGFWAFARVRRAEQNPAYAASPSAPVVVAPRAPGVQYGPRTAP